MKENEGLATGLPLFLIRVIRAIRGFTYFRSRLTAAARPVQSRVLKTAASD
jgi:hypothetical protein